MTNARSSAGLSVPTFGALLTAAEFLKLRWAVLASMLLIGIGYGVRLLQGQDFTRIVGYELTGQVGLMAAAIALGVTLRLRRDLRERSSQFVAVVRDRERSHAAAAIAAERVNIARELHDSLGHRAAVISMHADVAREAMGNGLSETRSALEVIGRTTSEMMTELRQTVRTLRDRQQNGSPRMRLSTLEGLFVALPIQVNASINIPDGLPTATEAAVCRIVQEAVTNVVKHSAAETTDVEVDIRGRGNRAFVHIEICDPGPRKHQQTETPSGFGIHGMRERAASLGGSLTGEPHRDGFRIRAELPVRKDS